MMDNNIRIRPAILLDKPLLVYFLKQMNLLGDDILAKNTRYWVAEIEDHAFVGCVGLEFGTGAVLLRSVAVSPYFRNEGLGRNLVNTAITTAKEMGYKTIYLFSVSSGSYWQKMGFQETPVNDLVRALPRSPQVLRFTSIGKLATETGWRKELTK